MATKTYGLDVLIAGIIDRLLHPWESVSQRQSEGPCVGAGIESGSGRGCGGKEGRPTSRVTWKPMTRDGVRAGTSGTSEDV